MRRLAPTTLATLILAACGGAPKPAPETAEEAPTSATDESAGGGGDEATSGDATSSGAEGGSNEFVLNESTTAKDARGVKESKIKPSKTEAAMRLFVVDKDTGPMQGVVISLTAPDGRRFYTDETDAKGYAEVLVPVGQTYELVYLSLGRRDVAAKVPVTNEPNQNVKLTMRYKRMLPPPRPNATSSEPTFVLEGVQFDTGKATIRPDSLERFDSVVEYLTHKLSARIEISGHTDNVGNPKTNKTLSLKRAQACRDYLISKGIDAARIEAVGYGDERPIASNDSEAGRQENRRIEATEL